MHVAVLGAGYGGLGVTRRLEERLPPDVDLTLVNDGPDHLLRHQVHRAIRRPDIAEVLEVPLADVLERATLREARVTDVDPDAGAVDLADGSRLSYDYGAVCLGSETAFDDVAGLEAHAVPLRTLGHAATVREAFLGLCGSGGRAVVGGAGLSGIQVAGELAVLATEEEVAVPGEVEIVLVEQLGDVAPGFPANFREAVRTELEARDVEVRTDVTVERVVDGELGTDAGPLAYDQLVWTGGIAGTDATGGERPVVRADLRLGTRTFALGDAAQVIDADGEPVPASAAAAIREAPVATDNLVRLVDHDRADDASAFAPRLERYRFDVPGWLVSVGDGAVAQLGPTVLTGGAAKATKATVGAGYLTSVGAVRKATALAEAELR